MTGPLIPLGGDAGACVDGVCGLPDRSSDRPAPDQAQVPPKGQDDAPDRPHPAVTSTPASES